MINSLATMIFVVHNVFSNKGKYRRKTGKDMEESRKEIVCVTGAGGFLGSWIVNILLQRGYSVRATVRDVGDAKNAHLKNLEGAKERLELLNADLLDYDSIFSAISGCTGVFHTACPVPSYQVSNPEEDLISPAVKGTSNVLKACSVAKVKRVIMTSSVAAVLMNPNRTMDILDESCWSDPEYCEATQNWYFMAKTVSEKNAWSFSKEFGIDLIIICPSLILGPMLQPTINASSLVIVKFLTGDSDTRDNKTHHVVDVRDCANAHLVAYESPAAAGRYICSAHSFTSKELSGILQKQYPQYAYPKNFVDVVGSATTAGVRFSNRKLQELGVEFRKLEETLVDSVDCLQKREVL